jgi:hypothetical protein
LAAPFVANYRFLASSLALGAASALISCAKPNYLSQPSSAQSANAEASAQSSAVCRATFEKSGDCLSIDWKAPADIRSPGSLILKISRPNRADGSPVLDDPPGMLFVYLKMTTMDMGENRAAVERLDVGTFRVSKIQPTMLGQWKLVFEIRSGGTTVDSATLDLSI